MRQGPAGRRPGVDKDLFQEGAVVGIDAGLGEAVAFPSSYSLGS